MFRWIVLLTGIFLLTGCDFGASASPTPTLAPSFFDSNGARQLEGCDPLQLSVWEAKFYMPESAMDDPAAIQAIERAFTELDYPKCVARARGFALQAYAAAARAATARAADDMLNEIKYEDELLAMLGAYDAAMQGLEIDSRPMPTAVPTEVVPCPGRNLTCDDLSCAQAYTCLYEGNTSLDRNSNGVPCEETICR